MRKGGLILTGVLLLVLGVVLLLASETGLVKGADVYESRTLIAIVKHSVSEEGGTGSFDPYFPRSEIERLRSKELLAQVITNLNLQATWVSRFKSTHLNDIDEACLLLKSRVTSRQFRSTSVIEISARSENAREAAAIANEIAWVYRTSYLRRQQALSPNKSKTVGKEAEPVQSQSDTNETALSQSSSAQIKDDLQDLERSLTSIAQKIESTKSSLEVGSITLPEIVEVAVPSSHPISPDRWKHVSMILAGLMLFALGVAILWRARGLSAMDSSEGH